MYFERVGYQPNEAQSPIHQGVPDVLQIVGAEGAGKSRVTAEEIGSCCMFPQHAKLVYIIGEEYANTVSEFTYLAQSLTKAKMVRPQDISMPERSQWKMRTRQGTQIMTLSVRKGAGAIIARGEQPDVFAIVEAGRIKSAGVVLAAARRATRSRGRVILSGTLIDNYSWYAKLMDELIPADNLWRGRTHSLPAWTNLHTYPGGRDDPEIHRLESILDEDEFNRTIAAVKAPSKALVFPEFSLLEHVKPSVFTRNLPVHLWVDPGYFPGAYAVVVVQIHRDSTGAYNDVWVVDELYLHHHIHEEVIQICKGKVWWDWAKHMVIDVAGRQHNADRSAVEVWRAKTHLNPVSNFVPILAGIARHRSVLKGHDVTIRYDPRCKYSIREYSMYRKPTDMDGNPTSETPLDKDNHSAKATTYGLVANFGFVERPELEEELSEENPFDFLLEQMH
jgi:hypothetical protein